jgi:hypothetical protein
MCHNCPHESGFLSIFIICHNSSNLNWDHFKHFQVHSSSISSNQLPTKWTSNWEKKPRELKNNKKNTCKKTNSHEKACKNVNVSFIQDFNFKIVLSCKPAPARSYEAKENNLQEIFSFMLDHDWILIGIKGVEREWDPWSDSDFFFHRNLAA